MEKYYMPAFDFKFQNNSGDSCFLWKATIHGY